MSKSKLDKWFPHSSADYREIGFLRSSASLLKFQYEFVEEGALKALNEIGWGLNPPKDLTSLYEATKTWRIHQDCNFGPFELPSGLLCSCSTCNPKGMTVSREQFDVGQAEVADLLLDWMKDLASVRDSFFARHGLLVFDSAMNGASKSGTEALLEDYRARALDLTEGFWTKIQERHESFLESSPEIENEVFSDIEIEIRDLGGRFYHVTDYEGSFEIVTPTDGPITIFDTWANN